MAKASWFCAASRKLARLDRKGAGIWPPVEMIEPRVLLSTYTVNTLSDAASPGPGLMTLRQAVAAANAHAGADTVNFAPTIFTAGSLHTVKLLKGQITFSDKAGATTVTGPGASVAAINGNNLDRVFNIATGVTVTISSLTITGGLITPDFTIDDASGGGIYNAGTLTLNSVTVTKNKADGNLVTQPPIGLGGPALGGGIYSTGTLVLQSSTISSNIAAGASDSRGLPSNPQGHDPEGEAADGGGIYSKGQLTITASTISGNSALGGKADPYPGGGNTSVYSAGDAYGGGIYANAVTINGSTISSNHAIGGNVSGSYASGGNADGGGIFATSVSVSASVLSGNTAVGGSDTYNSYAGYITAGSASGGAIAAFTTVSIVSSQISGNSARGGNGLFGDNGGGGYGGGIIAGKSITVSNSTLANNIAAGGNSGKSNGGPADGGGAASHATLTVSQSTVSGNSATGGSGAIKNGTGSGGGIISNSAHPLLNNSIIAANKANGAFNDIGGTAQSTSGFNLIGVGGGLTNGVNGNHVGVNNPKLSPLANHGGSTQTLLPLAGSPAIDAGSNARIPAGITTDQRGLPRIFGNSVDIGAVEVISPITISGTVFNDVNGDGIRQSSELGAAKWQVYIDLKNTGVFATGDPIATTSASGTYTLNFTPISAQPLIIREMPQKGWRLTDPALGYYSIKPISASISHQDFGNSTRGLISGMVFKDANGNGVKDSAEVALAGWVVFLDTNNNGKLDPGELSFTTGSDGKFSFVVPAGTYHVREVLKSGFKRTAPATGVFSITLSSGQSSTGENFGDK